VRAHVCARTYVCALKPEGAQAGRDVYMLVCVCGRELFISAQN
jgi:hypothetical protein